MPIKQKICVLFFSELVHTSNIWRFYFDPTPFELLKLSYAIWYHFCEAQTLASFDLRLLGCRMSLSVTLAHGHFKESFNHPNTPLEAVRKCNPHWEVSVPRLLNHFEYKFWTLWRWKFSRGTLLETHSSRSLAALRTTLKHPDSPFESLRVSDAW